MTIVKGALGCAFAAALISIGALIAQEAAPLVVPFPNDDGSLAYAKAAGIYQGDPVEAQPGAGREPADCRGVLGMGSVAVLLTFGQSNAANTARGRYRAKGPVSNFDWLRGGCWHAADPLLGASNEDGSVWGRLGDRLINKKSYDAVIVVPVAVGGTFIAEWAPGGEMHRRLMMAISRTRRAGLPITHLLWHQGEAEANLTTIDRKSYEARFHAMLDGIRATGTAAPIWLATTTFCEIGPPPFDNRREIAAAQAELVDPPHAIYAGPNTDAIGPERRYDRCHLDAIGVESHADMWLSALRRARPPRQKP